MKIIKKESVLDIIDLSIKDNIEDKQTNITLSSTKNFVETQIDFNYDLTMNFLKLNIIDSEDNIISNNAILSLKKKLKKEWRKTKSDNETYIKIGSYIRKNNFNIFKSKYIKSPSILVKSIKPINNGVIINKLFVINPLQIKVISKEEADELQNIWDNCIISETIQENSSCIREDTGDPKQKLGLNNFKKILFNFRVKREENFQAYICKECNKVHIGKIKENNFG